MQVFFVVFALLVVVLQEPMIIQLYCTLTAQLLPAYLVAAPEDIGPGQMLSEVLSGLLPYIGVIAVMLFCRRHPAQLRQFACWGSLFAAAFGYCFMLLHQWIPLIEGGRMQSTFAIGSLFTLIYTCCFALAGGYFGHRLGRMKSVN